MKWDVNQEGKRRSLTVVVIVDLVNIAMNVKEKYNLIATEKNNLIGKTESLYINQTEKEMTMTLTKRAKRIQKERETCNPDHKCLKCDRPIDGKAHHFFCKDCYVPGLMYSEEIKNKLRRIRNIEKSINKKSS